MKLALKQAVKVQIQPVAPFHLTPTLTLSAISTVPSFLIKARKEINIKKI